MAGELEALPPAQANMPAGPTRSNEDESAVELTPPPDAPSVQSVPAVAPLRLLNFATPPNVDAVLLEIPHVPLSRERVTTVPSTAADPLITRLTLTGLGALTGWLLFGLLYAVSLITEPTNVVVGWSTNVAEHASPVMPVDG